MSRIPNSRPVNDAAPRTSTGRGAVGRAEAVAVPNGSAA